MLFRLPRNLRKGWFSQSNTGPHLDPTAGNFCFICGFRKVHSVHSHACSMPCSGTSLKGISAYHRFSNISP